MHSGRFFALDPVRVVAISAQERYEFVARDALVELGWSVVDAERVLAGVDESLPVEEQVRAALKAAA